MSLISKLTLFTGASILSTTNASQVNWSFSHCDNHHTIKAISTTPAAPHLGKPISAMLEVDPDVDVDTGSVFEYSGDVTMPEDLDFDEVMNGNYLNLKTGKFGLSMVKNMVSDFTDYLYLGNSENSTHMNTHHYDYHYVTKSFSGTHDLCETSFHKKLPLHIGSIETDGFKCPMNNGKTFKLTANGEVTSAVRWIFPKGNMEIRGKNSAGVEFACVNVEYTISGWMGSDNGESKSKEVTVEEKVEEKNKEYSYFKRIFI